ncbi:hypothetical protein FRB95_009930 [Tulasnella sp. JGI-2019a]|nr:hypothetical protein FRB95_009930 [Tulasnella sp. JGI-2019a]
MDHGMTTHLPLQSGLPPASLPTFIKPSSHPVTHLESVTSAVSQAKRVVVVCGAGISVGAGIPDFRSGNGLFNTLKQINAGAGLSSGKDLFHARVFESRANTSLFNTMIGNLAQLAESAQPTPFHMLLKTLEDQGSLLRVYTQNIDCLEERAGLEFGLPMWEERRNRSKGKGKAVGHPAADNGLFTPPPSQRPTASPAESDDGDEGQPTITPDVGPSSLPSASPRCIPLHGHVKSLYCSLCFHSTPLLPHVDQLVAGTSVSCPSCEDLEVTRRLVGKRERGVGQMRPSVVLYGESHREGEVIGDSVKRDLLGKQKQPILGEQGSPTKMSSSASRSSKGGPDLLIVAGTSLKIPGTKRIVKEFSKAVRMTSRASSSPDVTPIKTILLNFEFPAPAREWEGVFDTWLQGDVQTFAARVSLQMRRHDEKIARVAAATALRRAQPSSSSLDKAQGSQTYRYIPPTNTTSKKRKVDADGDGTAAITNKRRMVTVVEVVIDTTRRPNQPSTQLTKAKVSPTTMNLVTTPKRTLVALTQPPAAYPYDPTNGGSSSLGAVVVPPRDHGFGFQPTPSAPVHHPAQENLPLPSSEGANAHPLLDTSLVTCMKRVTIGLKTYGAATGHAS